VLQAARVRCPAVHVGFALLTLFPGRVGGAESNVRGLLRQFAAGNGPERVTALANRLVMEAYAGFRSGSVELHHVRSYSTGDGDLARAVAMARARVLPRRAARDVPRGLDVVHYPVTVPIPRVDAPRVVTLYDMQHHDLPGFFSRGERSFRRWAYDGAARGADVVVATSAFSADRIAQGTGVPRERIEVVHMGIDAERFTPERGAADERLRAESRLPPRFIAYPANLWPHKNHGRLLAALAAVPEPDLALVLTGQEYGRLDRLLETARRLGVANRVRHLGHLPADRVPALYRAAAAVVYPSLYEGFGSPPLEAMACECPVAASTRGSLREVCGDAALPFDPDSTEEIAAAIHNVVSDPELRKRLRVAGLERVARFTWSAAAARHRAIYERVAATSALR
jgi:glycosyltransferase involved in cell wall biosynthesis